jgi:amino acid adenylation domain-containing protein
MTGDGLEYWIALLADAKPNPLPRPGLVSEAGATAFRSPLRLPDMLSRDLHRLAAKFEVPMRVLLIAAHLRVLGSLTSCPDVVTAVGRSGLNGAGEETMRLLPVRIQLGTKAWLDLAREVLRREQDAVPYADMPYRSIMHCAPHLAVDSVLAFTDHPIERDARSWCPSAELGDFALQATITIGTDPGSLHVDVAAGDNVHPSVAARAAGYYGNALASLAANPLGAAAAVDLRSPEEREKLRVCSTGPTPPPSRAVSLPTMLREQASARPDAIAVCDVRESVSYSELDQRVNRLARRLQAMGVSSGDRVGVSVHRGADMVTSLLAVMAAGAAFVPLDPGFPTARLEFIADDACLRCLLAGPGVAPLATKVPTLTLGSDHPAVAAPVKHSAEVSAADARAAYVMYTSGSSGHPKGTVIDHGNLASFFQAMDQAIGISHKDRFLALTSVSFDISVLEIIWPLTRGASIVVAPERILDKAPNRHDSLESLIRRFGPSLVQATPSFFTSLTSRPTALKSFTGLRALLVGGEVLSAGLARQLTATLPGTRIVNMYGPTETTIWSLTHDLSRGGAFAAVPPIGRPIAHTVVRVVDGLGNDASIGVPGELWIGGKGVARGYLNRPDIDRERFTVAPGPSGTRYYKTGDQVRWREDGSLDFIGRNDRQVKLHGHRIELDEIESVLSEHAQVEAAAVVVSHDPRLGDELVAYVRPRPPESIVPLPELVRVRELWDRVYREGVGEQPTAFPGWVNSYTRERFSVHDMQDWLDAAIARVRRLAPRRIIDVGAGNGLMLQGLRGDWDHYLAIDTSATALRAAAETAVTTVPALGNADFRQADALVLGELPDASADLVILNSVVQYFPSADYLSRVLDEAIRVVGPKGAIFVGDIRDIRLLHLFHADVQVRRSPPLVPARVLSATVDRLVRNEEELCLAPQFFTSILTHHDGFAATVEAKGERAWTEMSRFRWDVTITGPAHTVAHAGASGSATVRWKPSAGRPSEALAAFADRALAGEVVRLADVPNARLSRPKSALRALNEAAPTVIAWEVARSVWMDRPDDAIDPADAIALGRERGLHTIVQPANSGRRTQLDITFQNKREKQHG